MSIKSSAGTISTDEFLSIIDQISVKDKVKLPKIKKINKKGGMTYRNTSINFRRKWKRKEYVNEKF